MQSNSTNSTNSQPNPKLAPGQKAPDFNLPAVDGSNLQLTKLLADHKAVVVLFICNHCPYVKAYIPRLIDLQTQFSGSAALVAICSNDQTAYPEDSFENMKTAAAQWGLNFAYVRDEDQAVARAYGAERTPEIFVLDAQGVCRYEGGIDDNFQNPEKVKDQPLRDAVSQIIENKKVARPQTWAIGCTIKWNKV